MKRILIIIVLISTTLIFANSASDKFGVVKLNNGLPQEYNSQPDEFKNPFYAEIPSNDLFQKVYVIWDKNDSESYMLFIIFKNTVKSIVHTPFKKKTDDMLIDSSAFQNQDEFKSLVPYQIHLQAKKLELEYLWCNPNPHNPIQAGGIPQFIKPRLCKGKMMPEFNFKTDDGLQIASSNLKGKYVFIDFWGTWCGGCKYELPNISNMRKKISPDSLFIVGFVDDDPAKLKDYLSQNPLPYPNVIVDQDFLAECEITGFPTTVLVNPEGKILSTDFWGDKMWENVLSVMKQNNMNDN